MTTQHIICFFLFKIQNYHLKLDLIKNSSFFEKNQK